MSKIAVRCALPDASTFHEVADVAAKAGLDITERRTLRGWLIGLADPDTLLRLQNVPGIVGIEQLDQGSGDRAADLTVLGNAAFALDHGGYLEEAKQVRAAVSEIKRLRR